MLTRDCACGCGVPVRTEQALFLRGHSTKGRPGSRLGAVLSAETKLRMREAALRRYEGKRVASADSNGPGRLWTAAYRDARNLLVKGKPCRACGATEQIHAHHARKGDDRSLVPLCSKCHSAAHIELRRRAGAAGTPPTIPQAPLCACGCLRPVLWKRGRGWATFRKGHGTAKVSGAERYRDAPLCACGCGEPTKRHYGQAWSEYKTGHRQRVEGCLRRNKSGSQADAIT